MTRVLLLILGCAIQSEDKEFVVENIKSLDVPIQHAIMEYIQEVRENKKSLDDSTCDSKCVEIFFQF